ncbi:MAG: DUF1156 domain-containing protein [Desulfovibrio sp.]|jgi:putative DNA methylase|nr:DUF1156 domain-containing protein [Desulfovibrio sp.]
MMEYRKKLIEVALPLEAINKESAREKSIHHGHPSTLHPWWARRPLATARVVIFSSLVDDPSSHPEQFPTKEAQDAERQRLFALIEKLVKWENSNKQEILDAAKTEILKSTGGKPPALLDPFAGGGSIPLEAQRLGLEAHAGDLNPVAVMINKAMIEIPPKFAGQAPVNPEARKQLGSDRSWKGATGLAEDVRYYGEWMKREAFKRIGHLYPKVQVPKDQGGGEATVIAWIWARTVKCPNPACGCEMPLAKSFEISKKKGNEVFVQPIIEGNRINYVMKSSKNAPSGTVERSGAHCICCNTSVGFNYIRSEGQSHRIGEQLMAIVAEGVSGRIYISPDNEQKVSAIVQKPLQYPSELLSGKARVNVGLYGFDKTGDLFTNRQLTALTTFSVLVQEAQAKVEADALAAGLPDDGVPLADGGTGAKAHGQAVGVYLAFVVDKMTDISSSLVSWNINSNSLRNTFARQALPMVWNYAESNPFSNSSGCYDNCIGRIFKCIGSFPANRHASVHQCDAQSNGTLHGVVVSTDPPYYDNISYADLSDFFYIWLRQSLKYTYPAIFKTMLVPKTEELVATPYRFDGSRKKAHDFFERGMLKTFKHINSYSRDDIPVTIYYAFKQSESDADDSGDTQTASTGWETMLTAVIQAGFTITGTWPMRTERSGRTIDVGANALASSIVLVCRKRPKNTTTCTRRDFINTLKRELKPALKELQRSNIAPVDLAQAAIGPGMGVYSRFAKVLEADGSPMGVRSALQIINRELDLFFTEQDGELDANSRFCVDLYSQFAFNDMKFGKADVLARAKNISVDSLAAKGVLYAQKGVVHLLEREKLQRRPVKTNDSEKTLWLLTQQLTGAIKTGGVEACAEIVANMSGSDADRAKALAYRLFTIAEQKGWAQEAYAYNSLVIAWPDIQAKVGEKKNVKTVQGNRIDGKNRRKCGRSADKDLHQQHSRT